MAHVGRPYPWIFHRDIFINKNGWIHPPKQIELALPISQIAHDFGWGEFGEPAHYTRSNVCEEFPADGRLLWKFPNPEGADPNTRAELESVLTFDVLPVQWTLYFYLNDVLIAFRERDRSFNGEGWGTDMFGPWTWTAPGYSPLATHLSRTRPVTWSMM